MFGHKTVEKMRSHGDVAGLLETFTAAALKDDDEQARSAGEALVALGTPGIDALISALTNDDSRVGAKVSGLLGRATDPYALTALVQLAQSADADSRGWAVLAIQHRNEPEATTVLVEALDDPAAFIRSRAADALGARGDPRAIPELVRLVIDERDNVYTLDRIKMLVQFKDPRAVPAFKAALSRTPRTSFDLTHTYALEGLEAIGGAATEGTRALLGPAHDLDLLRSNLADLPLYYGRTAAVILGGGAEIAAEQIPIICRTLEDAARALREGVDPEGEAIAPWQVRRGLEALLADVSGAAVVGLMATQLTPDGVHSFQNMLARLAEITRAIPDA